MFILEINKVILIILLKYFNQYIRKFLKSLTILILQLDADPAHSNLNSQFLISVPSRLVAVAFICVAPNISVTLTVLSSTL